MASIISPRKKVRLDGLPWSPEFMDLYHRALDDEAPQESGPQSGTWEWLCRRYFAEGMGGLGPRTRHVRRLILIKTFDEPIKPGSPARFSDMPLNAMGQKAIEVLRDRRIAVPASANERLKAIRHVLAYGMKERHVTTNAAKAVEYLRIQGDGFYTWTRDDVHRYCERHPIGTKAYLAMALMLYTGARRSDVVVLGKQHIRHGRLMFTPAKTRHTTGKALELPVLPALQRAIEAGPAGPMTLLVTEFGRPYTVNGFGNWFKHRCVEAGLPQCSAHGLRKLGAVLAAENGATDAQLQAMFGWASQKMPAKYRKAADQRRLAEQGMHMISVQELDNQKSNRS